MEDSVKRTILLVLTIALAATLYAASSDQTLSVGDFIVNSDNEDYRYIGKGLSRMVAGELRKADSLTVIEREELNAVIEEQNLSLTGLIDDEDQLRIGRLLAADYIIVGEIIDMAGSILTTVRLVDAVTGEIAWQDELIKPLAAYDFISSYFAAGIIGHFDVEVDRSTEEKIEVAEEKDEEAILALSAGIDAYDRKDDEEARRSLRTAREVDPENETAAFYLNKLTANTSKFRIIGESYYALENPAYLGELKSDKIFLGGTLLIPFNSGRGDDGRHWQPVGDDWYFDEGDWRFQFGYTLPLIREKLGLSIQGVFSQSDDHYDDEVPGNYNSYGRSYYGGSLGLGYSFTNTSVGTTVSLFYETNHGFVGPGAVPVDNFCVSIDAGALFHSRSGGFTYGVRLGWSNATTDRVTDLTNEIVDNFVSVPLFWENSFYWELNNGRTFLVAKNVNDFYLDDGDLFLRLLPLTEHFFTNWFSLRGGLEGSVSVVDGSSNFGFGVLGGFTFRIPKSGWDFDVNITYRQRPSRINNNYMYDMLPVTFMISKEGLFVKD